MWNVGKNERGRVKAFTRGCKYTESNLAAIYIMGKYLKISKIYFVFILIDWNRNLNSYKLDLKPNLRL